MVFKEYNMDNRIFNVNGGSKEYFMQAMNLLFTDPEYKTARPMTAKAWAFDKEKGLILLYLDFESGISKFPVPLNAEAAAEVAWSWLTTSEDAKTVTCEGDDANLQHDGSNSKGWRIYNERWGHVGRFHGALCAVKPVYLWHGK